MSALDLTAFACETARLRLRPIAARDESLFLGLYTDPETMRFIGPTLPTEEAIKRFGMVITKPQTLQKQQVFVMVDKATSKSVGICAASNYDADAHKVEVGVLLQTKTRRMGYAKEALTALMRRIFVATTTEEIYVRFSPDCPAVERLNIRIGFTPCTKELQGKEPWLKRLWSVHRSTWQENQYSSHTNLQESNSAKRHFVP